MEVDKENASPEPYSMSGKGCASRNTPTTLSKMDQMKFMSLMTKAKNLTNSGQVKEALDLYRRALEICHSDKLLARIQKMEAYLAGQSGSTGQSESVPQTNGHSANGEEEENKTPKRPLAEAQENTKRLISQTTPAVNGGEINEEDKAIYLSLVSEAKRLIKEEQIAEALEMYRKAAGIYPGEKLLRKISQMENYLKDSEGNQEPNGGAHAEEGRSSSSNELNTEDYQKFNSLVKKAKQYATEGNVHEALRLNREALQIHYSEKLQHRITKMEEYLQQHSKTTGSLNTERQTPMKQSPEEEKVPRSSKKKSSSDLDLEDQRRFNDLVMKAKQLALDGKVKEAVEMNKAALQIYYSEKLQKRIDKMEEYLQSCDGEGEVSDEDENNGMIHIAHDFYLYKDLANKLYAHQKEGVMWMWGLHQKRKGGILGDDMGLGKTIQVIAFLSGLFDMDRVKSVLIVMPVSVIVNWEKEFAKWAPGIRVHAYHGNKKDKDKSLLRVQRKGGVLLTSYGLVVTSWEKLGQEDGREFKWDYMILDEGHKIKNPTKTTKGVHQIGARNRIILTGTPIQNNLRELWALFDFVHQGSLLGTARTFKMEFENPITRARERDATAGERKLGMEMAESLKKIIAPYFLRRTKAEVTEKGIKKEESGENPEEKHLTKMPSLTRKNDFIVWLFLTQTQQRIYSDFLSLDHVKELLMTKKSPLVALTVLKKICDHPRLLSRRGCAQLGLDGDHRLDDLDPDSEEGLECAANQIKDVADEVLIGESGKVIIVVDLLDKMKEEGHRCLLFSQSRKMLNIIEQVIKNRGHKVMRLDGTVTQLSERDERIAKFQNDESYSVFLLTTQVGGVGLTLTAADRVIIYDPSWNPATDAQAVDRVFRIGQDKNVVIYRLITCGTVEEKIYRRQIFKDSITRQTTGNSKNPYRYFTKQELRELFTLDNPRQSKTQVQLEEMHSGQRKTDSSLDAHVAFLYSLDIFGLSDHDLMFTQEKCDIDYDEDNDSGRTAMDNEDDYIQHRVQKAQELIRMESDLSQNYSERAGNNQRRVDDGQSGVSRPFAQPWQNWNFQGNLKMEDDADENNTEQKPNIKTEPEVSVKTEAIDLTVMEDDRDHIDLTTPPTSPNRSLHPSPSKPKVKTELMDETHGHSVSIPDDQGHIDLTSPQSSPCKTDLPHSSPSKQQIKQEPVEVDEEEEEEEEEEHEEEEEEEENEEEEEEEEEEIVEDLVHMSISESPKDTPVKVKKEKITPENKTLLSDVCNDSVVMESDGSETEAEESHTASHKSESVDDSNDVFETSSRTENSKVGVSEDEGGEDKDLPDLPTSHEGGMVSDTNKQPRQPTLVTPSRKNKRRSVSQSPWLKRTPKSEGQNVVREEILISPDGCRPVVGTVKTKSGLFGNSVVKKSAVNLNSTIMSAFANSPDVTGDHQRSRLPPSSHEGALGMTFVENSPGEKDDRMYTTIIEDSPDRISRTSGHSLSLANHSAVTVCDSVQNTPAVTVTGKSPNAINSTSVVGDSDSEETPRRWRNDCASDSSVGSWMHVRQSEEDSEEDDLPTMTKKKQIAAIISDDSEDEAMEKRKTDHSDELEKQEKISDDEEMTVEDSGDEKMDESTSDVNKMDVSLQDQNDEKLDETVDDSEDENFKTRPKKKSFLDENEEDESDEEDENDDTNLSGFIVDDSDEGEDDSHDEHSANDDDKDNEGEHERRNKDSDFSQLPREMQLQYDELVQNSRQLYKSGDYNEALAHVLQALEIFPDESLQALALKIHQKMMM